MTAILRREERRAAEINHRMDHTHGYSSALALAGLEVLNLLDIGVAVTDGLHHLLFANQRARQILATRDGLEVTALGVLVTVEKSSSHPLSVVIRQTAQPSAKDAVLAVPRSGKRPLTLVVRSVQGKSSQPDPTQPAVLVFMLDPELPVQATEAGLRQLYGLTASEARLAQLLMSGKTLEEGCEHLDIRRSTARMHLGNLFAKTGVRRQGELISLLLRSLRVDCTTSADRNMGQAAQGADHDQLIRTNQPAQRRAPETLVAGLEALDLLAIGVGVTNRQGRLLFTNQIAQQILATRDGLEVTSQGVLSDSKGCCGPPLSVLLQQAAQGPLGRTSGPKDAALAIRRPSGKRPLTLLVRSLNRTLSPPDATEPSALVFILDPEFPVQATESALRQLYGFTPSEARLARLLMEGRSLDDCCEPLNIRASTARRHLANMFAKAGVQQQGQLICLLLKSVGIVRVKGDERSFRYLPPPMSPVRNSNSTPSARVEDRTRTLRVGR